MSAPETSLQLYGDYDDAALLADEKSAMRGQTHSYFKLDKPGTAELRILPPKPSERSPFAQVSEHWVTGADGKRVKYYCPKEMANQPCPLCAYNYKLYKSGDTEKAKQWRAQRKYVAFIMLRADIVEEAGGGDRAVFNVWEFGVTLFDSIIALIRDPDNQVIENGKKYTLIDPYRGYDIKLTRVGTGQQDTKWSVATKKHPSPLFSSGERTTEILRALPEKQGMFTIPSPHELEMHVPGYAGTSVAAKKYEPGEDEVDAESIPF